MILIFGVVNQYGVLSHFSEGIKHDLETMGETCLVLPVDDGVTAAKLLNQISKKDVKFSLCINGSGLDTALTFGKAYALAVDHPLLILPHLQQYKGFELLCVAKEHTAFAQLLNIPARDFFHVVSRADITSAESLNEAKSREILFPASHINKDNAQKKLQEMGVWDQLKPVVTAVGSINELLMAIGVLPNGNQPARAQLNEAIYKITCEADLYIRALARERILASYTEKNIVLDVYGRNVKQYQEAYPFHRYHDEVPYKDMLEKMANASFVVHNSPGFEFALHERMVYPLAKGTPILFDANVNQRQMLQGLPAVYPSNKVQTDVPLEHRKSTVNEIEKNHTWAARLAALLN